MIRAQECRSTRVQEKVTIKNLAFILFTCALSLVSCDLFAQSIPSTELINNAKQYDGRVVVYEGEIIGDIMTRGDHAWVNVLEGAKAIGIWIERSLSKDIVYTGSYKSKGDRIEITGVFHRACPEHGGDLDIHAQELRIIETGRPVLERLNIGKRDQALIFLGVLILVWILNLFIRK